MGCLPSKPSRNDPFDHPGRTLASAPPPSQPTRASVPTKIASQGRTLGGGGGGGGTKGGNRGQGGGGDRDGEREDARGAAGRAAEVCCHHEIQRCGLCFMSRRRDGEEQYWGEGKTREKIADAEKQERAAKASAAAKGKIGKELQKERQKTVGEHLEQGSREERRRRDVDGWIGIRGFD